MTTRYLFVCHPKSISTEDLDNFIVGIKHAFAKRTLSNGEPLEVEITTGRESAEAWMRERRNGPFDWTSWIQHVTGSTSAFGGTPRFHYFVVGPERVIGRATADLLRKAMAAGRRVFCLNEGKLVAVRGVIVTDDKNWQRGWIVAT